MFFVKYLLFLNLMFMECRGEPLLGQVYTAQVINERETEEWLDQKQFSCMNKKYQKMFKEAFNNNDDNKIDKIIEDLKTKITFDQFYFWSVLYIYRDLNKILNYNDKYYYMTKNAYKTMKKKYGRWIKNETRHVDTVGNHVFLKKRLD